MAMAALSTSGLGMATPVHAQSSDERKIGGSVLDPSSGDPLRIIAVRDGVVIVEGYRLVLSDPQVGASIPDPAGATVSVQVASVTINGATGLVESVTLSDGRTIPVVRDVRGQVFGQSSNNPLARFDPLAPADENRGTINVPINGGNGGSGDNNLTTSQGRDGNNGGTRAAAIRSYAGDIEAIGSTLNFGAVSVGIPGFGIDVSGTGGSGGAGANGFTFVVASLGGGDGGRGGNGTPLTVNSSSTISTGGQNGFYGLYVRSQGGRGGNGGDGEFSIANSNGGNGGRGGNGGIVTINNLDGANITTGRANAFGIYGLSRGGVGGDGGDADLATSSVAGSAGSAGNGSTVAINNFGSVHTFGASAHGLVGQSLGGSGGDGGDATGIFGGSGAGSAGGIGGTVTLDNEFGGFIYTAGNGAHGILAQSIGGGGGAAGSAAALVALGNSAGSGKEGGNVTVRNLNGGIIVTEGARGFGMLAQSVGGGGGSAGLTGGLVAIGGSGGSGGIGRSATARNDGLIVTGGDGAHAAFAQSIGGGGGTGSTTAGTLALGGRGATGGNAGTALVSNAGTIETLGDDAHGALVQSIGGGGGNAGFAAGALSIGGRGGAGGTASTATLTNTGSIRTVGDRSLGVLAQSIGGGGGNGSTTLGLLSIGGPGANAGSGGRVNITHGGAIETGGVLSHGIVAQSIGGGGGNGGFAGSASAFVGLAIGRTGGSGGNSGTVDIDFQSFSRTIDGVSQTFLPLIQTSGDLSIGVIAQSVGGGGGNGGTAVQVTGGAFGAVSVAVGGAGGGAGTGGLVDMDGDVIVLTEGLLSHGILAQSVGGGGGNGGGAVSVSLAGGPVAGSVAVGVGGKGGAGGNGGVVDLDIGGFIGTTGLLSHGILAQSVGGGGGNGGFSVTVAGAAAAGPAVAIPVGVGGAGNAGGTGSTADVDFTGDIRTEGFASHGMLVQSVGGGGGNGGFNVSAGITGSAAASGSIAVGVGGIGGTGGNGGTAISSVAGNVETLGLFSDGIVTQSVGGSGGNGGYNVSGTLALSAGGAGGVAIGVGGTGGGAGFGGTVTSTFNGNLITRGAFGDGILSQSIGGGGGNGGINVSGSINAAATGAVGVAVGVGGAGGSGGNGGIVNATSTGNLTTFGEGASAFIAQSLGGGGGNGAINVSGALTVGGSGAGGISIGVGGSGGTAGAGRTVTASVSGTTLTRGKSADAIVAQSIGGSGGNGAVNVSAGLTVTSQGGTIGVGVGGAGGTGGNGGEVTLTVDGLTRTFGEEAAGIVAQSLGGGGGNGGVNVTAGLTLAAGTSGTIGVGVGGKGGSGGNGGTVNLTTLQDTVTTGTGAFGIIAQSLGGGGGNGGVNVTGSISASASGTGALGVGVGGFGGIGGFGNTVDASIGGNVLTTGNEATAVLVQSLGGGGGNGGINVTGSLALSSATAVGGSFGIGGFGGVGGNGGAATLIRTGDTGTEGILSNAITVQSIGGGGGNGGLNVAAGVIFSAGGTSVGGAVGIGGFGSSAGNAGKVVANISGSAIAMGVSAPTADTIFDLGSFVLPLRADGSHGIFAQSVGGSGGSGGINISGGIGLSGSSSAQSLALGLGGFGGGGGNGGEVDLDATGTLYRASGDFRAAVFVQSLGGGGGDGALNVSGGIALNGTLTAGVGGFGAAGGTGGLVDANVTGQLVASGLGAIGLLAQSVGGGGGNGGVNISGGISAGSGSSLPAVAFGLGGTGGDGSAAGTVNATHSGSIMVMGAQSRGIFAQSVGGGGGNGGFNVAAALGTSRNFNLGIGVGGSGGAGSTGGAVTVVSDGQIIVDATDPDGIENAISGRGIGLLAQSIGGGGGNAGFNIAGAGTGDGAPLSVGIGGSGAAGGAAGAVTVNRGLRTASLISLGQDSDIGLLAQSIGGGGGNAGGNIVVSGSTSARFDVQLAIGGAGGAGGDGGTVNLTHIGDIAMAGANAHGIVAQSIGGGGGNAAMNLNLSFIGQRTRASGGQGGARSVDLQIGGGPGAGSDGGAVTVDHTGIIMTGGDRSTALFAQSIGGGGGNAADQISQNFNDRGSLAVAIGRIGGTGGLGGDVMVTADGMISTMGQGAHAIHAQSIGGGGGNSSTTTVSVEGDRSSGDGSASQAFNLEFAIGLEGGEGSAGGMVTVDHLGLIETSGADAHGIFAQSIGGGGGNGGAAIIDRLSEIPNPFEGDNDSDGEYSLAVQIGGAGGSGAVSDRVTVTNTGTVLTFGKQANAIRALSIGGGGGDAGAAFNVETPGNSDSYSLGFTFGGDGGTGATGGNVEVTNLGILQTSSFEAAAIYAQSIGGGGGNAGLAGNFSKVNPGPGSRAVTLDYNHGGTGGMGGAAGSVTVVNGSGSDGSASILTLGERSYGIFAQSIGGGGGNGGSTLSGNFAGSSKAYQLAVNIGGRGGIGGVGGLVSVDNFGVIETRGKEAHGIFAQSIGGGGGNGGLSLAFGNLYAKRAFPNQALIAIGGAGGNGNDAGNVVVTNSGSIFTSGEDAHGIFAQSLGGGGGNMSLGLGLTFDPQINAGVNFLANTVGILLGAQPGDGGLGGEVTVTNTGDIAVSGKNAFGIVAESINGGGGGLVMDLSGIAGFVSGDLLPGFLPVEPVTELPALTLFGGAAGQGSANAEKVTITSTGTITARGDGGAATNLMAIGGGGGRIVVDLEFTEEVDARAVALPIRTGLGGRDSANVMGGDIASAQIGNMLTEGANTPGVLLQSIGGGGGRSIFSILARSGQVGPVDLAFGGSALSNAAGGLIEHSQTGNVVTLGDNSVALLAQSIGGGGGVTDFVFSLRPQPGAPVSAQRLQGMASVAIGTASAGSPFGNVTLGTIGGTMLDGGAIAVTAVGNTMSAGDASPAIVLQSIGAGGGLLNNHGLALGQVTLGGRDAASGNGGSLSLTHDGMILTEGHHSHGVVLQSTGGGGGAVFGAAPDVLVKTSADNSGSGGTVSFTQTGDIVTSGAGSSALVVQSLGGGGGLVDDVFAGTAGGSGSGGAINVMIDGDVLVTTGNVSAILLQSLGSDGAGPINLALAADRAILVGSEGIAIEFDGGSDNTFANFGTVMTQDGLMGTVMQGSGGNDLVSNAGMLIGNFQLGGGTNALDNLADGTLLTGSIVDLGGGTSTLTNQGTFAPGGTDTIVQTQLNGNFVQSAGGSTFLEIDAADDTFDAINATGSVALGGQVDARLLNPTRFIPGMKAYRVFTGAAGADLADADLRADSSVVLNLLGIAANGDGIELQYDMTFAPVEAEGNQQELGLYLDRVQAQGVSSELQPTFDQLIFEQDAAVYVDFLNQLGADIYAEQDARAIDVAEDFGRTMANCGLDASADLPRRKAGCAWAQVSLADTVRDAIPGSPRIDGEVLSFSAGAHYAMSEKLSIALAVGYSDLDLAGYDNRWMARGEAIQFGVGTIYQIGATELSGFASYGETSFDTTRELPGFGSSASSARDVEMIAARVGINRQFDFGGFKLKPGIAVGLTGIGGGDAIEQGAGPNDLSLGGSGGTFTWVMPQVEAGYSARLSESWTIRPYARAALRQYLSNPVVNISARFAADTTGVDPFVTSTTLGRSHFVGEAGLDFASAGGIRFGALYRVDRASDRRDDGARVYARILF
ncbi:autotransporter outer membrane beta-barrel domain-containing protein [Erythrobacter sp. NFXS35]